MKPKKERQPRKDFAEKLRDKLQPIGCVESGSMGDNSGRWIDLKVGDVSMCISFDMKGENITNIGLYKDVVQVVNQKQLFSWRAKYNFWKIKH
jgi:hypothetical protein